MPSSPATQGSAQPSISSSRKPSLPNSAQQHVPINPSILRHSKVLSVSPEELSDQNPDTDVTTSAQDPTGQPRPRPRRTDPGQAASSTAVSSASRPHLTSAGGSVDSFGSPNGAWVRIPSLTSPSLSADPDELRSASQLSVTKWPGQRQGAGNSKRSYFLYYLPMFNWIRQYRWVHAKGDLVAALTMASFYIPMSLSYAANLGHIPPIHGLYSFVFQPFVYAILGTCPQMVVGPEAAGSLLTGQVVRENIKSGHFADSDPATARIAGAVTGLSGAIILLAGLCRLGFLDSVLSRPFLRGFISSIGIVILVDQLIPEMGLDGLATGDAAHGSSLQKIIFLFRKGSQAHKLTCAISFGAFVIVMACREIKKRLQPRYPAVAYVPDRFFIVALSAVLTWSNGWDRRGLDILGDIREGGRPIFEIHWPLRPSFLDRIGDAFSTAFLVALLGFFESSVAAKSLGKLSGPVARHAKYGTNDDDDDEEDDADARDDTALQNVVLSTNRELVALGCANLLGGLFMSLPAFGGYGRSKVNASTGGRTPMSSVFLSLITIICTVFLLPYFYYIPKGVLSAMISVVAYSLIEEAPHDIAFFWTISGYNELVLMLLIIITTVFWNLRIGMAVGIGLSLLRLLKHATRPRIQILGRVPGGADFENAEGSGAALEFFPRCLIVRIPEPLTFANTGSLKDRLRRLEDHGTNAAHPALPRVRSHEHNKNVIFDVHGVTGLDPAAAQVLLEIVTDYAHRGVRVFFCRVTGRGTPRSEVWRLMCVSGVVEASGGEAHFVNTVQNAIDLTEKADARRGLRSRDGAGPGDRDVLRPLLR